MMVEGHTKDGVRRSASKLCAVTSRTRSDFEDLGLRAKQANAPVKRQGVLLASA